MTPGGVGMWRLILISFVFMGWSFYELSGGADYAPGDGSLQAAGYTPFGAPASKPETVAQVPSVADAPDVTRVSLNLTDLPRVNVTLPSIAAPVGVQPAFEKARIVTASAPDQPEPAALPDIRAIRGSVVNMRNGPGTNYSVLTKLRRGDQVEIVRDDGNGWLKLRVTASGRVGWMADSLVTAASD